MRRFFLVLLAFISFNMAVYAADRDIPIRTFILNNGHKVIVKEIHANPIVTIDTWVKAGTADETTENNGVSHFLEHLLFKGTTTRKNGVIEGILESKGARFNAATSKDYTHYYVTIASDYIDTAIKLHADMLQNPAIPPEELQKERLVVQEEIRRANDDPKRVLIMDLFDILFNEHPYKMDTLGPNEVIETITREQIFDYYNEYYVPSNFTTVIVGDVKAQEVLTLMKEYFSTEYKPGQKKINTKVIKRNPDLQEPVTRITRGEYKSGYAYWGFKGVPVSNIKETYSLDLAASILGGSNSSRLYQNLKEKLNLVTDIGSSHYSLKNDSIFIVSADFKPEKFPQVKAVVMEEIDKLRSMLVNEEELERAKTLAKRSFMYQNESVQNISGSLGYTETLTGNIDSYKKHIQYIESVNLYDIQKVAKKYLLPERLALTALLPDEVKVNMVLSDKTTIKESTKSTLNNGITLISTQNPSNDIIAMSVFMKGGIFSEPMPGAASILVKSLMYGTKNRPYLELIKEIEHSGISILPHSKDDYFEIQVKTTKNEFNKAFEILADIIKNPAFEQKYIDSNKADLLAGVKKARDYPVSISSENFLETLYKGHPYGHIGKTLEEGVPEITRDAVVKYWEETFVPANMIVSVSGDVEHAEVAHKLAATFSSKGQSPPEIKYNKEFKPIEENIEIITNKDSAAAWIFMGWPVGNISDNEEFATFKVLNSILSDGLSSRLHKTFREEQGLAYRVGSTYSPKMDRGHFVFLIGTAPKNIELVKEKFLKEIERLKTEPVSKEELEDNKSKLIGSYALSQETNQNKAHLVGVLEVIDKDFGFNYDFPDLINNVTSEDIIRIANKYFNYPYILSITAPQPVEQAKR